MKVLHAWSMCGANDGRKRAGASRCFCSPPLSLCPSFCDHRRLECLDSIAWIKAMKPDIACTTSVIPELLLTVSLLGVDEESHQGGVGAFPTCRDVASCLFNKLHPSLFMDAPIRHLIQGGGTRRLSCNVPLPHDMISTLDSTLYHVPRHFISVIPWHCVQPASEVRPPPE